MRGEEGRTRCIDTFCSARVGVGGLSGRLGVVISTIRLIKQSMSIA